MATMQVGDRVIYTKDSESRPVLGTVNRVTKTMFYVGLDGPPDVTVGPFAQDNSWLGQHARTRVAKYGDNSKEAAAYEYSEEKLAELNEHVDRIESRRQDEKEAAEKRDQERADRKAKELAEVKAAWAAKYVCDPLSFGKTMPDGSRIYVIDVPVHPEYAERKKGWERINVRCVDAETWDFMLRRDGGDDKVKIVESALTFTNGSASSWPSCSTERAKSDEEAVWEAMRYCYFNW